MTTLKERFSNTYGWMRGQYPASIEGIVEREPTLAKPIERIRKGAVQEMVYQLGTPIAISLFLIPEYGAYIGFAGIVASQVQEIKGRTQKRIAQRAILDTVNPETAHGDLNDLEQQIALYDLEERIQATDYDFQTLHRTIVAGTALAFSAMLYQQDRPITALFAGCAAAFAAVSAVYGLPVLRKAASDLLTKNRDRKRRQYDTLMTQAIANAKNVTPTKTPTDATGALPNLDNA